MIQRVLSFGLRSSRSPRGKAAGLHSKTLWKRRLAAAGAKTESKRPTSVGDTDGYSLLIPHVVMCSQDRLRADIRDALTMKADSVPWMKFIGSTRDT